MASSGVAGADWQPISSRSKAASHTPAQVRVFALCMSTRFPPACQHGINDAPSSAEPCNDLCLLLRWHVDAEHPQRQHEDAADVCGNNFGFAIHRPSRRLFVGCPPPKVTAPVPADACPPPRKAAF